MRGVQTVALDGVLQLIDDAEGRATTAQIAPPGLPPVAGGALLPLRQAHDLFLLAFQRLFEAFGRADHPRDDGDPGTGADADACALAVWELDGHEVALAVRPDENGAASVVVEVRPPS
jgi:hypothetical protein